MKRLLYIENEASINAMDFYRSALLAANSLNIEFHVAYNAADRCESKILELKKMHHVIFHQVDFCRNPLNKNNIKAYRQIDSIIKTEHIDAIHCNTPIGGVVGRIAGVKNGIYPIIYQAHGFHFYKGAPLKNWLLYYSAERFLARKTDVLITINKEDYWRLKRFHLRNHGKKCYVPGVGIDLTMTKSVASRKEIRNSLMVDEKDFLLISTGDLIYRKNYKTIINALDIVNDKSVKLIICGEGPLENELRKQVNDLNLEKNVLFLGRRNDVPDLLHASDAYVMSSLQEGLSRSVMEAMVEGLPLVISKIRGNMDLVKKGYNGFLCLPDDANQYARAIRILKHNDNLRMRFRANGFKVIKKYELNKVSQAIKEIYKMF